MIVDIIHLRSKPVCPVLHTARNMQRLDGLFKEKHLEQKSDLVMGLRIFLDLVMPHRSGLEILKELRAQQFFEPIVIVSARDDFSTVVEAMKNGAHDYLRKPFDFNAPVLRARSAVEEWSRRQYKKEIDEVENCEWFRLTPSEKDMLFLMRSFDI